MTNTEVLLRKRPLTVLDPGHSFRVTVSQSNSGEMKTQKNVCL